MGALQAEQADDGGGDAAPSRPAPAPAAVRGCQCPGGWAAPCACAAAAGAPARASPPPHPRLLVQRRPPHHRGSASLPLQQGRPPPRCSCPAAAGRAWRAPLAPRPATRGGATQEAPSAFKARGGAKERGGRARKFRRGHDCVPSRCSPQSPDTSSSSSNRQGPSRHWWRGVWVGESGHAGHVTCECTHCSPASP